MAGQWQNGVMLWTKRRRQLPVARTWIDLWSNKQTPSINSTVVPLSAMKGLEKLLGSALGCSHLGVAKKERPLDQKVYIRNGWVVEKKLHSVTVVAGKH